MLIHCFVLSCVLLCSGAMQQDTAPALDGVHVLNIDMNCRLSRQKGGHSAEDTDRSKPRFATRRSSDADKLNRGFAVGPDARADTDAEVVGGRTGMEFEGVEHPVEEMSHGHTTNVANEALRMAPFTQASHGVSSLVSEVAPDCGNDIDDERDLGDGTGKLRADAPAALSRSPLSSSSSTPLSGHRLVQHMLKQIQDAGERINERISARDFGARRRLPTVPRMDSDPPARGDPGGPERHRRPVCSALEELPRRVFWDRKSPTRNSGCATPRLLPDTAAVKSGAKNSAKPESCKSLDCSRDDENDVECCGQFPAKISSLVSSEDSKRLERDASEVDAVGKVAARGLADGESPRNMLREEADGKTADPYHLPRSVSLSEMATTMPLCCQSVQIIGCSRADGVTGLCSSTDHFEVRSLAQKSDTVLQRASDRTRGENVPSSGHIVDHNAVVAHVSVSETAKLPATSCWPHTTPVVAMQSQNGDQISSHVPCCDQPHTCWPTASAAASVDDCLNMHVGRDERIATSECQRTLGSCDLCDDEHIFNELSTRKPRVPAGSDSTASSACDGLEFGESSHHASQCHENFRVTPETGRCVRSETAKRELSLKSRSAKNVDAATDADSRRAKSDEPFCLAGPKRALCSQSTFSRASSGSSVITAGGKTLVGEGSAVDLVGNVRKTNSRRCDSHMPVIISTNAAAPKAMGSAAERRLVVNRRSGLGSVSTTMIQTAASRVSGLPAPVVRFSTHGQKPAPQPAANVSQARFVEKHYSCHITTIRFTQAARQLKVLMRY